MPNPLIVKLEHGARLTDGDRRALEDASRNRRRVAAREDLIVEGEAPDDVHLIIEGLACRYKMTSGGGRQIMAYLVPGDFCDLHVAILGEMDHAIATLSDSVVVHIPRATIEDLVSQLRINRALWWATLVDEAILREWLVNMGQRSADQRLAHLFCELLVRLRTVGLAEEDGYDWPVTQEELADTIGVSTVHVNRILQTLREQGLIELSHRRVRIPDADRLMAFADFTPNSLHLDSRRRAPAGAGGLSLQAESLH